MVYRETFFANPDASSSAPYPQELNPWSSEKKRFTHRQRRRMRIKHQLKIRDASLDRQPKVLSSLVRETLQRVMGQTNNDSRFQIFILTSSLHQQPSLVGRQDSRLRSCSQFPTEAMQWIKEVEMVDSVDD